MHYLNILMLNFFLTWNSHLTETVVLYLHPYLTGKQRRQGRKRRWSKRGLSWSCQSFEASMAFHIYCILCQVGQDIVSLHQPITGLPMPLAASVTLDGTVSQGQGAQPWATASPEVEERVSQHWRQNLYWAPQYPRFKCQGFKIDSLTFRCLISVSN